MGQEVSKAAMCCDCDYQSRSQIVAAHEVYGVSSMKLNENNQRFLRTMAEAGKSEMILGLFSTTRDFDINASDLDGNTALHKAAQHGHVVVCHILWKHGARLDAKNKQGKTALDLARDEKYQPCIDFLSEPMKNGGSALVKHRNEQADKERESSLLNSSNPSTQTTLPANSLLGSSLDPSTPQNNFSSSGNSIQSSQNLKVKALYNYKASKELPFAPDTRMELDLGKGDEFMLLYKRQQDGWCLVYRLDDASRTEGWVPGNFITADGRKPIVNADGTEPV